MDLTNKTFTVTRLAVNNIERFSNVQVTVFQKINDAIKVQVGVYDLKLNKVFTGLDDPQLSSVIKDTLETIPE